MSKTADVIRVRRSQLRLSQDRLAELVGVTQRQIGRYESGEQSPSLAVSVRLAEALRVSLAELAGAEASGIDLSGEWWAAWQGREGGARNVHVRLLAMAQDREMLQLADGDRAHPVGDGSYSWRGELRLWDEVLTGWYRVSDRDTRYTGSLYFALHPSASHMIGSWTSLLLPDSLTRGWCAVARDRERARQLVLSLIDSNGGLRASSMRDS